ncbi:MAG: dTMP kinase [bacterium]|nr:dTMP kinase [bacterium]
MLICITGIDGCGKGTQIYLLREVLERKGLRIFISKAYDEAEKEGLSHFFLYWDDVAITLAFQALHRQQFVKATEALGAGQIVLADRWDESYLAYHSQFGLLSQDEGLRRRLNKIAFEGKKPDLTFLLKISPERAGLRTEARGRDFFDGKDLEYHARMAEAYETLACAEGWVILDGEKKPLEIHSEIMRVVLEKMGEE